MSIAESGLTFERIQAETEIVDGLIGAVESCFTMCDTGVKAVGVSTIPSRPPGPVTGMVGVHGQVSGFVTVNLAEKAALRAVGGLLQESFGAIDSQVLDGVGEITNIIAGGIKGKLSKTNWSFTNLTVPSVIIGDNYNIAFTQGLIYTAVMLEVDHPDAFMMTDRLMQVAISLIRL